MAVEPSSVRINLTRDELFDDFTLQTLRDRYMVPGETSPQHAFARASAAFADDEAHAQRLYDYVSKGWFMFATPLLSNGGTARGLPISCFLSTAEDSREGIFDHWTETGWLSSVGGGVGGYWGGLRSNGEKTSHGSSSTGAIPFIATVDRLILAVSQGGTRRGSYAAYLDISHPEIEEFITFRKPSGDENRKATNLHNAVCITDEFMIAVRDDTSFDLRDPKSNNIIKTLQARELWHLLMETRKQTGEPYLFFVDTANRALPEPQKKKGLRVYQSNLCVAPDTPILTDAGYKPIGSLTGTEVDIWNGEAWSTVLVHQTNASDDKAELMRVWFEDGSHLDCTPYHKFYDQEGTEIRAGALKPGTILERVNHPKIMADGFAAYDLETAYAAGFATFVGFEDKNRLAVFSADAAGGGDVTKRLMTRSSDAHADVIAEGFYIRFEPKTIPAGRAPLRWTIESRLAWFAGVMDAAGEWVDLEDEGEFLGVVTTDADMVREMRLAALEAGLSPRIRITDNGSGFMLNRSDAHRLISKNLILTHQSKWSASGVSFTPLPKVADVHPLPWRADTFCFTDRARGRGVFNGVLTGNCTEITLPTGRDDEGNKRTAVCCLSSVNAEKIEDWAQDMRFIPDLMRMLDNCLQVFIDNAPPALAYAVYSAKMERSVGLGLLGFHAYLQKQMVAFESTEARIINKKMFHHIRRHADYASIMLGAERGEAPDMAGTGERFAHKMAIAPNASSSILCGNTSPSIEPWRSNAYLHKTLSGSFAVKNPYLERELAKYGLDTPEVWKAIISDEGSVQNLGMKFVPLDEPAYYDVHGVTIPAEEWEHLQQVFKTFTELDMRWVIQHGRDRQGEIDQAQSVNVAFPHDADAGYISEVHYRAWDPEAEGTPIKSLYYYRSTTPKRAENTNSKVERKVVGSGEPEPIMNGLSANPMDDSTCIACEG